MVGPQLGRETDAIAESAYKIKRKLCVTTLHVILKSGRLEKWSGQSRTSRTGGAAPVVPFNLRSSKPGGDRVADTDRRCMSTKQQTWALTLS